MSAVNPYAPPKAHVEDVSADTTTEAAIRREHIKHETSVRSIGTLYYFGGGVMLLGALGLTLGGATGGEAAGAAVVAVAAGIYFVMGAVSLVVAYGIRRLRPWARYASIVLSAISLLGLPFGTIIGAYILYLLLSAKGRRIFAADYPDIVAATPDVKYRTSIVVWVALGLLLLLILAAVLSSRFG
jgi:hypothetical protein